MAAWDGLGEEEILPGLDGVVVARWTCGCILTHQSWTDECDKWKKNMQNKFVPLGGLLKASNLIAGKVRWVK